MPSNVLLGASSIFLATCVCTIGTTALAQESRNDWILANSHSIEMESANFDDLAFLRPLLKGKRIVQLGENTHGVREYSVLKARIVQFLHQELGYEVLAFESDIYQCHTANELAAELPAFSMTRKSTMLSSVIGVWHTKEVLPVFEYLRATRDGESPLQLAGFDVQPIGNSKKNRPQFLSELVKTVDTKYATEVLSLDNKFLEAYALRGAERRAFFRSDEGMQMAKSYERLAAFFKENKGRIEAASTHSSTSSLLVARQAAMSMVFYIRKQAATDTRASYEYRDEGMAKNMNCLLDELFPDKKIIVWGHNFHIRHRNEVIPPNPDNYPDVAVRSMGSWLHERYGDKLYTVGFYAYEGKAANNSGKVFDIEPAKPETLEGILHPAGIAPMFVDMSRTTQEQANSWIYQPTLARHNGTHALKLVPRDQYDAILFVDKVSPREMLY